MVFQIGAKEEESAGRGIAPEDASRFSTVETESSLT
jgi:hypothetical protein